MTKQEQIEAIINKSCNENAIALSEVETAIIALDLLKSELIAFDRVMGVPIERATLPKGVQFVVAERKVKENEK